MLATSKRLFPSRTLVAWSDIGLLAAIGLVASWVDTLLIAAESSNSIIDLQAPRSPLYHYVHGVALLAVMAAGLLAISKGQLRVLSSGGRIAFLGFGRECCWWAVTSYTVAELFSREILGSQDPSFGSP